MANEVRALAGALYVDYLHYEDPTAEVVIANTIPADTETDVAIYSHVTFQLLSLTNVGFDPNNCKVWLTALSDGISHLAFDASAGGWQAGYTGTQSLLPSPGSGVNDQWSFDVDPVANFTSLDYIVVDVSVGRVAEAILYDFTYTFIIEDLTAPALESIFWLEPTKARLKFDEPVRQTTVEGGALFIQHHLGGVKVISEDTVEVKGAVPASSWIGCWGHITGSAFPWNNRARQVIAINSTSRTVTFDLSDSTAGGAMTVDDGKDLTDNGDLYRQRDLRIAVSPYRFVFDLAAEEAGKSITNPERVQVGYEPAIISLAAVPASELPADADPNEYIYLTTHDMISFGRYYSIECVKVEDSAGNRISTAATLDFQTPDFGLEQNMLGFWSEGIIAPHDPREDMAYQAELRELAVVLQDSLNCLHWHNMVIEHLHDFHRAPMDWVEHQVYSVGNPLQFGVTDTVKRKLPMILKEAYRKIGRAPNIEDVIYEILGLLVEVRPYQTMDYWTVGDPIWGKVGYTTIPGPGTAYLRNCYEIVSPVELTDEEEEIIRDIAEWFDPMHMHLVRILEPSDIAGGASAVAQHWIVGTSAVGSSTIPS